VHRLDTRYGGARWFRGESKGEIPAWGRVAALAGKASAVSTPAGRREQPRERRAKHPGRRPVGLRVTLTEEEREQLGARASEAGVSMSRLLVESALSRVETAAERRRVLVKLNRFERLLGNLANNVNQLAHQANIAGQIVALERLSGHLDELGEMRGQLRELVEALR
jgi:hypothetical protein